ncbi:MAG: hypothetical protein V1813_01835 [Candidatus Aenigmatarchaeota archaeon]
MADQKLLDYIRENLAKGVRPDDIRLSLLESGWPQEDIDAGMAQASAGEAPPAERSPPPSAAAPGDGKQKKKGHKKLIVLLIVLLILVFFFLYTAASIVDIFRDMFPGSMDSINNILGGGGNT